MVTAEMVIFLLVFVSNFFPRNMLSRNDFFLKAATFFYMTNVWLVTLEKVQSIHDCCIGHLMGMEVGPLCSDQYKLDM